MLLWFEPRLESFEPFCTGVCALNESRDRLVLRVKSFPCDRVRLGKQGPDLSAGKRAPGTITSVCNCLLTANAQASYPQRNVRVLINNTIGRHHLALLSAKTQWRNRQLGQKGLIPYQTDYFTNYSTFCVALQRRGTGNLNREAALFLGVRPN